MASKHVKNEDPLVSGQELAARLGITPTRVSKLGGDGVMVRVARGKYRLWASIRSYVAFLQRAATQRESPTALARKRLLEIQIRHAEARFQRECGDLVPRGAERQEIGETLRRLFAEIVRYPWRLASMDPSIDRYMAQMLEDGLRRLLSNTVHGREATQDGEGTQFPEPWLQACIEREEQHRLREGKPIIRWPPSNAPKPTTETPP
jgi:hypothetical protein